MPGFEQPKTTKITSFLNMPFKHGGFAPPFQWLELFGYVSLVIVAFVMRLWDVGSRAMHHDESLHALHSWYLFKDLHYQHNPMMHGPFQFEANAAIFFILGDNDVTARLLYVVLGTTLVAMPIFFRQKLGHAGAIFTSLLLAISPSMLYFSRFARNDIIMAVWVFGLVISMWRFLDQGKNRYLYLSAGLLALAFSTKESSYLVVGTLGLFLILQISIPMSIKLLRPVQIEGVTPPIAFARVIRVLWESYSRGIDLTNVSRSTAYFLMMITLTLPLWSAFAGALQNTPILSWTHLVLVGDVGHHSIGSPIGGAKVIAFVIVAILTGLSIRIGYRWNWPVWWRCALIFWIVWILLYTTFFLNFLPGIYSGSWSSLGYWVVQQGEARGGQPWYYYFVLGSVYEYLPIVLGIIASIYFIKKRDQFNIFLIYWSVVTFLFYTIASEKMPWLLVNITLPFILLSGKFLGVLVTHIKWKTLVKDGGVLAIAGVPIFFLLLWQLAFYDNSQHGLEDIVFPIALAMALLGLATAGFYLARRMGFSQYKALTLLVFATMLAFLTIRTGWIATYRNGDVPVEMLVYTQTSPDVTRLLTTIKETGSGYNIPLSIDQTNGFTWPWAWYLRDAPNVDFPTYGETSSPSTFDAPIVIVHSQNIKVAEKSLQDRYTEGSLIRHRWWFPEQTYRNLTPGDFFLAVFNRDAWKRAMDYWIYRRGVYDQLGSENSYVYFLHGLDHNFLGQP